MEVADRGGLRIHFDDTSGEENARHKENDGNEPSVVRGQRTSRMLSRSQAISVAITYVIIVHRMIELLR